MPRKYRPPAARRRKTKRAPPVYIEPLPEDGDTPSALAEEMVSTSEPAQAPVMEPIARSRSADRTTAASARHITRDYSYVRAEVRRIVMVAGFLIVALIITALLRN